MFYHLIVGCIAVATIVLFLLNRSNRSYLSQLSNHIPGPRRVPIIGQLNIPTNGKEAIKHRKRMIDTYGHVYKNWFDNLLFVFISDPQDAEVILRNINIINKGGTTYNFFKPWLGSGLLVSGGAKWHARRKELTPTFHFKILEQFVEVFNRQGLKLIQLLDEKINAKAFNIYPYISNYALDVICETAMGTQVNAQDSQNMPYKEAVRWMSDFIAGYRYRSWLINTVQLVLKEEKERRRVLKILHHFTNNVIKAKKEAYDTNSSEYSNTENKKKTAFLELMLNLSELPNSSIQTDEDLNEEVNTFMFAGHDTTSSALSSALCLLAQHQTIQDKLWKEVREIITCDDYMLSYKDLQRMKYTEMVLKEVLRLYPSVPTIGRSLSSDLHLPSGYTLPAGTQVVIDIYNLHRNTKYFKNPEKFNPDNFLPENSVGRHAYAYVPFSAGPRNCIGQRFAMLEMKTTLSKIIYRYKIEYGGSDTNMQPSAGIVFKSDNGFIVKLSKRII